MYLLQFFGKAQNTPETGPQSAAQHENRSDPQQSVGSPVTKMPLYGKIVVIKRNGSDGTHFPLTASSCLFGRKTECDIRIQLPHVSKEHCKIEVNENKEAIVTNLSSVNPTQLNGSCIQQPVTLMHGDVLTIIERSFRFEYPPQSTPRKKRNATALNTETLQQVAEVEPLQTKRQGSSVSYVSEITDCEEKGAEENDAESTEDSRTSFTRSPTSAIKPPPRRSKSVKECDQSPFSELYEMLKHRIDIKPNHQDDEKGKEISGQADDTINMIDENVLRENTVSQTPSSSKRRSGRRSQIASKASVVKGYASSKNVENDNTGFNFDSLSEVSARSPLRSGLSVAERNRRNRDLALTPKDGSVKSGGSLPGPENYEDKSIHDLPTTCYEDFVSVFQSTEGKQKLKGENKRLSQSRSLNAQQVIHEIQEMYSVGIQSSHRIGLSLGKSEMDLFEQSGLKTPERKGISTEERMLSLTQRVRPSLGHTAKSTSCSPRNTSASPDCKSYPRRSTSLSQTENEILNLIQPIKTSESPADGKVSPAKRSRPGSGQPTSLSLSPNRKSYPRRSASLGKESEKSLLEQSIPAETLEKHKPKLSPTKGRGRPSVGQTSKLSSVSPHVNDPRSPLGKESENSLLKQSTPVETPWMSAEEKVPAPKPRGRPSIGHTTKSSVSPNRKSYPRRVFLSKETEKGVVQQSKSFQTPELSEQKSSTKQRGRQSMGQTTKSLNSSDRKSYPRSSSLSKESEKCVLEPPTPIEALEKAAGRKSSTSTRGGRPSVGQTPKFSSVSPHRTSSPLSVESTPVQAEETKKPAEQRMSSAARRGRPSMGLAPKSSSLSPRESSPLSVQSTPVMISETHELTSSTQRGRPSMGKTPKSSLISPRRGSSPLSVQSTPEPYISPAERASSGRGRPSIGQTPKSSSISPRLARSPLSVQSTPVHLEPQETLLVEPKMPSAVRRGRPSIGKTPKSSSVSPRRGSSPLSVPSTPVKIQETPEQTSSTRRGRPSMSKTPKSSSVSPRRGSSPLSVPSTPVTIQETHEQTSSTRRGRPSMSKTPKSSSVSPRRGSSPLLVPSTPVKTPEPYVSLPEKASSGRGRPNRGQTPKSSSISPSLVQSPVSVQSTSVNLGPQETSLVEQKMPSAARRGRQSMGRTPKSSSVSPRRGSSPLSVPSTPVKIRETPEQTYSTRRGRQSMGQTPKSSSVSPRRTSSPRSVNSTPIDTLDPQETSPGGKQMPSAAQRGRPGMGLPKSLGLPPPTSYPLTVQFTPVDAEDTQEESAEQRLRSAARRGRPSISQTPKSPSRSPNRKGSPYSVQPTPIRKSETQEAFPAGQSSTQRGRPSVGQTSKPASLSPRRTSSTISVQSTPVNTLEPRKSAERRMPSASPDNKSSSRSVESTPVKASEKREPSPAGQNSLSTLRGRSSIGQTPKSSSLSPHLTGSPLSVQSTPVDLDKTEKSPKQEITPAARRGRPSMGQTPKSTSVSSPDGKRSLMEHSASVKTLETPVTSPDKQNMSSTTHRDRRSAARRMTVSEHLVEDASTSVEPSRLSPRRLSGMIAVAKIVETTKSPKKRRSGELDPLTEPPLKRKRVSFGGHLSPELFDKRLPPNSPLRRGATPARLSLPFCNSPRAVIRKSFGLRHAVIKERSDKRSPHTSPAKRSYVKSPAVRSLSKKSPATSPAVGSPGKRSPATSPAVGTPVTRARQTKSASPVGRTPSRNVKLVPSLVSSPRMPDFIPSSPQTLRGRFSISRTSTPPVALHHRTSVVQSEMRREYTSVKTPETVQSSPVEESARKYTRKSFGPTTKKTPSRRKSRSNALEAIRSRRKSGATEANLLVAKSWADVVKLGVARPQVKNIKHGVRVKVTKKKLPKTKTPARKVKGHFSTGHADSPATIVIGRAHSRAVSLVGKTPRVVKNYAVKQDLDLNESFTGIADLLSTPPNEQRKSPRSDGISKSASVAKHLPVDVSIILTPEESGEMMVSPLSSTLGTVKHKRYGRDAVSLFSGPGTPSTSLKRLMTSPKGKAAVFESVAETCKPLHAKTRVRSKTGSVTSEETLEHSFTGIKRLMKTPKEKPKSVLDSVAIKRLLATPRVDGQSVADESARTRTRRSSGKGEMDDLVGIKRLMKTPKQNGEVVVDMVGVSRIMKTPKQKGKPVESKFGIRRLMKTPKQKSGYIRRTPKQKQQPVEDMVGISRIMKTPKKKAQPVEDMIGIKRLLASPKQKSSPLEDLKGLKRLLRTPKERVKPVLKPRAESKRRLSNNDLNYSGIKELFDSPKFQSTVDSPDSAATPMMTHPRITDDQSVHVSAKELPQTHENVDAKKPISQSEILGNGRTRRKGLQEHLQVGLTGETLGRLRRKHHINTSLSLVETEDVVTSSIALKAIALSNEVKSTSYTRSGRQQRGFVESVASTSKEPVVNVPATELQQEKMLLDFISKSSTSAGSGSNSEFKETLQEHFTVSTKRSQRSNKIESTNTNTPRPAGKQPEVSVADAVEETAVKRSRRKVNLTEREVDVPAEIVATVTSSDTNTHATSPTKPGRAPSRRMDCSIVSPTGKGESFSESKELAQKKPEEVIEVATTITRGSKKSVKFKKPLQESSPRSPQSAQIATHTKAVNRRNTRRSARNQRNLDVHIVSELVKDLTPPKRSQRKPTPSQKDMEPIHAENELAEQEPPIALNKVTIKTVNRKGRLQRGGMRDLSESATVKDVLGKDVEAMKLLEKDADNVLPDVAPMKLDRGKSKLVQAKTVSETPIANREDVLVEVKEIKRSTRGRRNVALTTEKTPEETLPLTSRGRRRKQTESVEGNLQTIDTLSNSSEQQNGSLRERSMPPRIKKSVQWHPLVIGNLSEPQSAQDAQPELSLVVKGSRGKPQLDVTQPVIPAKKPRRGTTKDSQINSTEELVPERRTRGAAKSSATELTSESVSEEITVSEKSKGQESYEAVATSPRRGRKKAEAIHTADSESEGVNELQSSLIALVAIEVSNELQAEADKQAVGKQCSGRRKPVKAKQVKSVSETLLPVSATGITDSDSSLPTIKQSAGDTEIAASKKSKGQEIEESVAARPRRGRKLETKHNDLSESEKKNLEPQGNLIALVTTGKSESPSSEKHIKETVFIKSQSKCKPIIGKQVESVSQTVPSKGSISENTSTLPEFDSSNMSINGQSTEDKGKSNRSYGRRAANKSLLEKSSSLLKNLNSSVNITEEHQVIDGKGSPLKSVREHTVVVPTRGGRRGKAAEIAVLLPEAVLEAPSENLRRGVKRKLTSKEVVNLLVNENQELEKQPDPSPEKVLPRASRRAGGRVNATESVDTKDEVTADRGKKPGKTTIPSQKVVAQAKKVGRGKSRQDEPESTEVSSPAKEAASERGKTKVGKELQTATISTESETEPKKAKIDMNDGTTRRATRGRGKAEQLQEVNKSTQPSGTTKKRTRKYK